MMISKFAHCHGVSPRHRLLVNSYSAAITFEFFARPHLPNRRAERDALIAATAMVHGLIVVSRNVADFKPTGVALLNPWIAAQT